MDIRHLEVFARVVEAGSFSAAARQLHCSQPAISQLMRALERSVGGPLFLRVGRGLQLTEAGRVLAERCTTLLRDLAVAKQQVRAIAEADLATVRVCAFPSANASLVPQAAAALVRERPHIRLQLIEHEPPDSLELLRQAECEVVIAFSYAGVPDTDGPGFLRIPFFDDPLVVLLNADHELADRASLSLSELHGQRWIAGCDRCSGRFLEVCAEAGFAPDIVCATDDNMAIQSLVASGLGISLAPRLVLSFLRHTRVAAVPLTTPIWRHVAAYTWPDLLRVSAVRATLDALTTAARNL